MLCLLDPGDLTARQSTFGCGEFGNVVEEEQKSQVDLVIPKQRTSLCALMTLSLVMISTSENSPVSKRSL